MATEWAGAASLGQLVGAAGERLARPDAAISVDGRLYGPDTPIDRADVHDGSVVSLSATFGAETAPTDPTAVAHLAVVNGPQAGTTVPLRVGTSVVGRSPQCDLTLSDPAISARHVAITVEATGRASIEDLGSTNGTAVDGTRIEGTVELRPGQLARIGDSAIELRPGSPADAVVHPNGPAYELRRPPRLLQAPFDRTLEWPYEPEKPGRTGIPMIAMLAPIVLGGVMYFATHQVLILMMVGLSPLMMIGNLVTGRRGAAAHYREATETYRADLASVTEQLEVALAQEAVRRRAAAPDPVTVLGLATGPRRQLWERRRWDGDFGCLRLGLADLPSVVRRVQAGGYSTEPLDPVDVSMVPAVLPLAETGVLGVTGPSGPLTSVAHWLIGQAVCLSGPSDLQLVVLAGDETKGEERWGWTRWLPHVRSVDGAGAPSLGTSPETVAARVSELIALVEQRQAANDANRGRLQSTDWPRVLVVLDPAYDLRRTTGIDVVLKHGPAVDVLAVCVEEAESYLPVECRAVLAVDEQGRATLRRSGQADLGPFSPDLVEPWWAETIGRRLAPLRDPEVKAATGTLPSSVRLVDLLGLDRLDAGDLLADWSTEGRSTSGVIGEGLDGPVALDLKRDGPHGLVAGTTGAGKSEFLQTLVASLAVANRHDALNFLLIDYKGGSAFRDCARLPHTVGVVTDLDGHLTERALTSLSAELKRREELLARGGAKDIDDYVDMGEPAGAMPRLLIVIDEFAGLVAELPEFVTGLVGIAQRGRSLGIHLILATQRPSGVVSPEIRANTNLRVALRVTSPAESVDIIDAPDAARITPATPGRAFAMTGHSALVPFQSARVGGRAAVVTEQGPEVGAVEVRWVAAGRVPQLAGIGSSGGEVDPADTDLARLVGVLIDAADRSVIPRQPQPWLPPLPKTLALGDLDDRSPVVPGKLRPVPLGLVDLPDEQRQEAAVYDVEQARHLIVGGSPGSGRTTLLRTLALSLAGALHPDDLWLYVVDCGGGELRRLTELPHCGAVVTRTEQDRADRLLARLHGEMARRLELLASSGFTDVGEQRAAAPADQRLPYLVVLIDRWEGFMSTFDAVDNGRLTELVFDLAREGGAAGIRLVVSGDRTALIGKLPSLIDERICLNLAERSEFAVAGFDVRRVPVPMDPGRAVRTPDTAELQVAVAGAGPSGPAQLAAVADLAARWKADEISYAGDRRPFRVDPLPADVREADATKYGRPAEAGPHWSLLGVGGDELGAIGVDLLAAGGFVVAGPRRSGRSNTLVVMAHSLIAGGCEVLAF